ncbi:hypothetical protein [Arthrobacter castelli]|uniref:hypothetical protein n=1 Tax=Arthrobacter castelli TaxID=271431 RepID=UPI0012DEA094|nr:hypothetical protein [Arthrobacter castelli]
MSIDEREWKLWREGEPFPQRFTATISEDGNTITGRWEKAPDGQTWQIDFNSRPPQGHAVALARSS